MSGDVIIRHLAAQLKPEYVVFLVSTIYGIDLVHDFVCWMQACELLPEFKCSLVSILSSM